MMISRIARAFVARHCVDLDDAVRRAPLDYLGARRPCVVSDPVASFNSYDKVVSARLYEGGPCFPWLLGVQGRSYNYSETSVHEGFLTMYGVQLPEAAINHIENSKSRLTDVLSCDDNRAPFYLQPNVKISRVECVTGYNPCLDEDGFMIQFDIEF